MKCEECLPLLEDFVEGEIGGERAERVGVHLAGCQSCTAEADALRRELEIYASYERDIAVTPALWDGVWSRIEREGAPPRPPHRLGFMGAIHGRLAALQNRIDAARFGPALAVATLAAVVAGTTLTIYRFGSSLDNGATSPDVTVATSPPLTPPERPGAPPANIDVEVPAHTGEAAATERLGGSRAKAGRSSSRPAKSAAASAKVSSDRLPGHLEIVRSTEREYLAAIAVLARDVDERRGELLPATRERVDSAIAELDRTIEGTRRAVVKDPSDPVAVQYLLTAYARKVEVLQEVASR